MKKYYITQIYFTENDERNDELKRVIEFHKTSEFDKVYYLNEKIYGYDCDKIQEINIGKRLSFNDVFDFVKSEELDGAIFFGNSDIYFNSTINNVLDVIAKIPIMYCQLRAEHKTDGTIKIDINSPLYKHGWSQDVWIYHSKFNNILHNKNIFDIELGTPGCDNKIIYLFKILGFNCYNEPEIIKSYHFHKIMTRNYDQNTTRPNYPYYAIFPVLKHDYIDNCRNKFNYLSFDINEENKKIYDYILTNINNNKKREGDNQSKESRRKIN